MTHLTKIKHAQNIVASVCVQYLGYSLINAVTR